MTEDSPSARKRGEKPTMPAKLINTKQFAQMLGCSTRHIQRLTDGGLCPRPIRLGAAIRWSVEAVEAWMADGCPKPSTQRRGVGK